MDDPSWLYKNGNEIFRTAFVALRSELCDRCLGRLFGRCGFGLSNRERGSSVRTMLAMSQELLTEENADMELPFSDRLPVHRSKKVIEKKEHLPEEEEGWITTVTPSMRGHPELEGPHEGCWLCHDMFDTIDRMATSVLAASKQQEFSTFLIGCRMDPGSLERERTLWKATEPSSAEPLKEELNREIGKAYSELDPDKTFDRDSPDVTFLVDPLFQTVDVTIKPVFIKGRYIKKVRGIPQTRWTCTRCDGKGCERCGGKGKMYETSVEELIGTPVKEALDGADFKLHGMGREDIDVRTLGRGRPFVLEIPSPRKRHPDMEVLTDMINKNGAGMVEVTELAPSSRNEVPFVKEGTSLKRYRARIVIEGGVDEETLKYNISLLAQSPINQRTPWRVSHRRADKIRVRRIHEASVTFEGNGVAIVDLLTDGGMYIKELLHGDEGRTVPSLASLIGRNVRVETLDVTDVLDDERSRNVQG
ncbi:MAG: tRNA pseudouridine(54/55) synthase Pus10 [Candidatus Thermoplasmatota archaeon]|nr:tRNA pseudouridine(54/55) synthase Pus10 [Candidatus Thermoplasmatota archaeon]